MNYSCILLILPILTRQISLDAKNVTLSDIQFQFYVFLEGFIAFAGFFLVWKIDGSKDYTKFNICLRLLLWIDKLIDASWYFNHHYYSLFFTAHFSFLFEKTNFMIMIVRQYLNELLYYRKTNKREKVSKNCVFLSNQFSSNVLQEFLKFQNDSCFSSFILSFFFIFSRNQEHVPFHSDRSFDMRER